MAAYFWQQFSLTATYLYCKNLEFCVVLKMLFCYATTSNLCVYESKCSGYRSWYRLPVNVSSRIVD